MGVPRPVQAKGSSPGRREPAALLSAAPSPAARKDGPTSGAPRAPFRAPPPRPLARAVICLDQPFCRLTPAHTETGSKFPRELHFSGRRQILAPIFITGSQQASRGVQQRIGAVLGIIFAFPIAIADSNHLDIGT